MSRGSLCKASPTPTSKVSPKKDWSSNTAEQSVCTCGGRIDSPSGGVAVGNGTATDTSTGRGDEWVYWDMDETEVWQEEWRQVKSRRATRKLRKQFRHAEEKSPVGSSSSSSTATTATPSHTMVHAKVNVTLESVPSLCSEQLRSLSAATEQGRMPVRCGGARCAAPPCKEHVGPLLPWALGESLGWDVVVARTFISVAPNDQRALRASASAPGRLQSDLPGDGPAESGSAEQGCGASRGAAPIGTGQRPQHAPASNAPANGPECPGSTGARDADEAAGPPTCMSSTATSSSLPVGCSEGLKRPAVRELSSTTAVRPADVAAGMAASAQVVAASPAGKAARRARNRAARATAKAKATAQAMTVSSPSRPLQLQVQASLGPPPLANSRVETGPAEACACALHDAGPTGSPAVGAAAPAALARRAWPGPRRERRAGPPRGEAGARNAPRPRSGGSSEEPRVVSLPGPGAIGTPVDRPSVQLIFADRGGSSVCDVLAVERCASKPRTTPRLVSTAGESSFAVVFAMALAHERAMAAIRKSSAHRKMLSPGPTSDSPENRSSIVGHAGRLQRHRRDGRSKARKGRAT